MAVRYAVGISGTVSWADDTYWSTSSGGAGGASYPLDTDDAIINSSSGSGTMNAPTNTVCKSLDMSGFTGSLTIGTTFSHSLNINGGALIFGSGMNVTGLTDRIIYFLGTCTVTMNGKQPNCLFSAGRSAVSAGTLTLQDALTLGPPTSYVTGLVTFVSGSIINTNNQSVSVYGLYSFVSGCTLTLGSSNVTIRNQIDLSLFSTINYNTSTVILDFGGGTGTDSFAVLSGNTLYNLTFQNGDVLLSGVGAWNVTCTNTFKLENIGTFEEESPGATILTFANGDFNTNLSLIGLEFVCTGAGPVVFSDSTITNCEASGALFDASDNCVNGGGNIGFFFGFPIGQALL